MCNFRVDNSCQITQSVCPWVYWCDKVQAWKELSKKPKVCNVQPNLEELPKGTYYVKFERNGYLYVSVEGGLEKIKNIFNYQPLTVQLYKYKGEWKIKKEQKEND